MRQARGGGARAAGAGTRRAGPRRRGGRGPPGTLRGRVARVRGRVRGGGRGRQGRQLRGRIRKRPRGGRRDGRGRRGERRRRRFGLFRSRKTRGGLGFVSRRRGRRVRRRHRVGRVDWTRRRLRIRLSRVRIRIGRIRRVFFGIERRNTFFVRRRKRRETVGGVFGARRTKNTSPRASVARGRGSVRARDGFFPGHRLSASRRPGASSARDERRDRGDVRRFNAVGARRRRKVANAPKKRRV